MNHDLPPTDQVMETILDRAAKISKEFAMREAHLRGLVSRVSYKNWGFKIGPMGNGHFLQCVLDVCDATGDNWKGRKWYLSPHMIDAEVIMTAFKAVLTAEEHETREQFLYDGAAIFGPHLSLEALVANAHKVATR